MEAEIEVGRPLSTSSERSGTAVAAALFSVMCPIGIGGLIGLTLGVLALSQISAGRAGRDGAGMAWIGIIAGLVQLVAIGAGYMHLQRTLEDTRAPVESFLRALTERDSFAVAESCANGLKPKLSQGVAGTIATQIEDAVGHFVEAGERVPDFELDLWNRQVVLTVTYRLHYDSGAPMTGTFALVRESGALRLIGFKLDSPVLRPRIVLGASNTGEIAEYDGPKNKRKRELREFKRR